VPDQILTDIFNEHLPYEIDMLRETYRLLTPTTPATDVYKNALIEAFCVHARSLLDFFMYRKRETDVVASNFATGFIPQLNDVIEPLKTLKLKLNKQIFHLTKSRKIVEADKFDVASDGIEVVKLLEGEIARFAAACVGTQFGQLTRNTQPISVTYTIPAMQRSIQTTSITPMPKASPSS
jgi:hypothetical protein